MSLLTSAAVQRAEKGAESRAASTTERENNSSDMEIDDDDEEGEEDLQGSSSRNDAINIMEPKGHNGCLGSDSLSTLGKFETRIPSKTLYVGESTANLKISNIPKEPLANQKEEKSIEENVVSVKDARVILEGKAPEDHNEQQTNSKSHLVVNEIMHGSTNLLYNGLGSEEKNKPRDVQTKDDKRRTKSRSAAPQTSNGSLSPSVEFKCGNKRPALICDFFARGWCIKGSSCRFLHVKDSVNNPKQQPEEDVAAEDGKRAIQLDEGFRNAAERSRSPVSTDTLPSSVVNKTALSSHFFTERILPLGHDDSQRLHLFHEINKFPLLHSKDKSMGSSPGSQMFSASTDDLGASKDVRQNSIGQNLPADNYAKPASLSDRCKSSFRNSFLPECISSLSGSVASFGNTYKENQSYRVSTWLASLPFSSSSSACTLGAQKFSNNDRERHTSRLSSLLQGSSPFSGSEPENFPVNDFSRDPLHFAEYRMKVSSDDWEPSIPFQPSFFVTSGISSPRSQYDPLRDSLDVFNAGERSLKFSFSSQGQSLLNIAYPPTHGDSTSKGLPFPECNGDKRNSGCDENLVKNNCYTSGKDSLTTDANDGTSAVDLHNGTQAKEEISSVASHVKDISKTKKIDTDHDGMHCRDKSRCKKDLKEDRVKEKNEIDVELENKADGDAVKESKARRHFHGALVDLIKELLKPSWREGHLSKDAHNTIVKKAVDKVLGTIQPHQIPITFESVKQYLSSSQPKIEKLVEGYIDKYRKS